MYSDGGYLTKKIRHIEAGQSIDFDIIEQSIRYATSIPLKGGTIQIEAAPRRHLLRAHADAL